MIQYNVCETCGAKEGQAGYLIQQGDGPNECKRCALKSDVVRRTIDIDLLWSSLAQNKAQAFRVKGNVNNKFLSYMLIDVEALEEQMSKLKELIDRYRKYL